nr:unknown [Saccharomyces cerevisiae]
MLGKETEKSKNRSWRGKTKHQARTFRGYLPMFRLLMSFNNFKDLISLMSLSFAFQNSFSLFNCSIRSRSLLICVFKFCSLFMFSKFFCFLRMRNRCDASVFFLLRSCLILSSSLEVLTGASSSFTTTAVVAATFPFLGSRSFLNCETSWPLFIMLMSSSALPLLTSSNDSKREPSSESLDIRFCRCSERLFTFIPFLLAMSMFVDFFSHPCFALVLTNKTICLRNYH